MKYVSITYEILWFVVFNRVRGVFSLYQFILVRLWNKKLFAYVNHARIRSWNQPVLSNESNVSCSRKQRGPLMGLELTTDRYPPIMNQTHCPPRHAASVSVFAFHKQLCVCYALSLNKVYWLTIKYLSVWPGLGTWMKQKQNSLSMLLVILYSVQHRQR